MAEEGLDRSDRTPREITSAEVDGGDAETVRAIRDEIERRVVALFDELLANADGA